MGKLEKGTNDLLTWCIKNKREDILDLYDKSQNPDPSSVAKGTNKKYYWKCERCGIGYLRIPHNIKISSSNLCFNCEHEDAIKAKKIKAVKDNNFGDNYSELAKEWDYKQNTKSPYEVSVGSHDLFYWIGKCGHNWQATIPDRIRGDACPYCSSHRLLSGFNDFETVYPELAKEWHPQKNGDLLPSMFTSQNNKKVWWLGKCGHEWEARISGRARGNNCPICNSERQTSFPEQAILFYVKKYFCDAVNSDINAIGMELDIYIPSIQTAIEYDGKVWHTDKNREEKKNEKCLEKGVKLIRIREKGLELYDECICIVRENPLSNSDLNECIRKIFITLNTQLLTDVDVDKDYSEICELYIKTTKSDNLLENYPILAREWHPSKNGILKPDMVKKKSGRKVWWLGKCGHEWQATIKNRIGGADCPYCYGKKVLEGLNDLKTVYPNIAKEWHPTKNGTLKPTDVRFGSAKKVWWMCKNNHEWEATVSSRTGKKGSLCPECQKEARKIKVMLIETGVVYNSIKEAADSNGLESNAISACCKGKLKTTGGYHWRYVEELK